jgi:predicted lipoprotein with Yx(FWY)xxD motif
MRFGRLSLVGVVIVIAAVVAIIATTTGGSKAKSTAAAPANSAISLRQTPLGSSLVDGNGRTLYLFEADKPNRSMLSAAGQAVWPPFTASTRPRALNGALAGNIGIISGTGGTRQVTYSGHPLYYFAGDHNAGQTLGQGLNEFGALWYVLARDGSAIISAPAASSSAPSSNGSSGSPASGYGY